jgi:hypothetical protein
MRADLLDVVTCISNPIRWGSRIRLAKDAIAAWVGDGVRVTLVECAYGDRPFDLANLPGVTHIPVRAKTLVWNKENLINVGISRLPADAKYIAWIDADVHFRNRAWAAETVHELQLYPVLQPWSDCYDLGPNGEHMAHHVSFCRQYFHGKPVTPSGPRWWRSDGGPYDYPHSGYCWAATREFLNAVGGLFELGGMGSGDHHMALGMVGKADWSMPPKTNPAYKTHVLRWQERARKAGGERLGFVRGTIEHAFHGRKADRRYVPRWDMFVDHAFDPDADLIKNAHGVFEFAGNKPALERSFDRYLRDRLEDINVA